MDNEPFLGAASALAAQLSRQGYKGCKENGDVSNCLTHGCPCGNDAFAAVSSDNHPLLQMGEDLRPTTFKAKKP